MVGVVIVVDSRCGPDTSGDPEECVVVSFGSGYIVLRVGGVGGVRERCEGARALFGS